ncbi:putative ABC transport system permease protein [Ekhidna lutea]|uniref:Putative ABC transport system permease protein n=1 Tax=Ekhidna lutea TaxID=447679 RepID=A0A239JHT7_EKHLU|nr:ABC transporter permease [Ekhidna lutea]SNT05142.1 putative ABC transport system permease protein [Ekhidna lutea]
MIKKNIKLAFRTLLRSKSFSIINIIGLGLGIGVSLLILKFVSFELSFDKHYTDYDQIYRVPLKRDTPDGTVIKASNVPALAPAITEQIPEVKFAARLFRQNITEPLCIASHKSENGIVSFNLEEAYYADPSLLDIFSYDLIAGSNLSGLKEPNTIILTQTLADKLFKHDSPIGKTISIQTGGMEHLLTELQLLVTGVIADPKKHSHLQFEALISYSTFEENFLTNLTGHWGWTQFHTYIKTTESADLQSLQQKINDLVPTTYKESLAEIGYVHESLLQPVDKIHLNSGFLEEPTSTYSKTMIIIFMIMAFFILAVAWINYINLTTAQSLKRSKEIGIRKVIGAQRTHLIHQFLTEALLFNVLGLLVGLGIVKFIEPFLESIIGRSMEWPPGFNVLSVGVILLLITIIGVIVAGGYPSLVISSYQPLKVLKGKLTVSRSGILMRKGLVVFQFMISIILITTTLFVYRQLTFMQNQDLGIDLDQTLVIKANVGGDSNYRKFNLLKERLRDIPFINSVTATSTIPAKDVASQVFSPLDNKGDEFISGIFAVDYDFIQSFGLNLVAGRSFERTYGSDTSAILVSESTAKRLGYTNVEDAINKDVFYSRFDKRLKIIGVISDYYHSSVKNDKPRLVYQLKHSINPYAPYAYYLVRFKTNNLNEALQSIETAWQTVLPEYQYDAFFLDEYFNQQYLNELRFSKLTGFFAAFAMLIGAMGLFGLVSFTFSLKIKEVGIRRALGASMISLQKHFWKDYLQLIFIAAAIATPICYFSISEWLSSYPIRIQIEWWMLMLPILALSILILLIVGRETLRVGSINPSKTLKQE